MKKSRSNFFTIMFAMLTMLFLITSCSQGVNMNGIAMEEAKSQSRLTPPPPSNLPYPQHAAYGNKLTKPAYSQDKIDNDVANYFVQWKNMYIKPYSFINGARDGAGTGYIIYADSNGHIDEWAGTTYKPVSQSEATGYAMITFAIMANYGMDAQEIFDGMFTIYRNFPCKDNPALMSWAIPAPDATHDHNSNFLTMPADFSAPKLASASDGDMDVAYALLMADKQWGSQGRYNYLAEAKKIIAALEQNAIFKTGNNSYYPRLNVGDRTPYPKKKYEHFKATRSSDWMLTHTSAFYKVTGNQLWKDVQDVMVRMAQDGRDPVTGLVSDFYGDNAAGQFSKFEGISDESGGKYDDDYYYNASRFPWRMAMGYAHSNVAEAQQFNKDITSWLVGKFGGINNFDASKVTAGYDLSGNQLSPGGYQWDADAFNGPFLCGMAVSGSEYSSALTRMWDNVMVFEGIKIEWGSLSNNYFDDTLSLMALLFVSGNWWSPVEPIVKPDPPTAPTGLRAIGTTESTIALDWNNNPESNIKEYRVYRQSAPGDLITKIATVTASEYTNTGLTKDTAYLYMVKAVNTDNIESSFSNMIEAKTDAGTIVTPPAAPTGLKVTATTQTSITLDWNNNSETNVTKYRLYTVAPGGPPVLVAEVSTSNYVHSGLPMDSTQVYVVTAVNVDNLESNDSAMVTGKTDAGGGSCTVEAWDRTKVYGGPTVVCHNGKHWKSKWWTKGEEPGTTGQWGVWTDLGTCSAK